MTENQKHQFIKMYTSLKVIASYQTPKQLRKDSKSDWGLDYEEALEMSYENVQNEAKRAVKGISIKKLTEAK